jgi:hypothetical protein
MPPRRRLCASVLLAALALIALVNLRLLQPRRPTAELEALVVGSTSRPELLALVDAFLRPHLPVSIFTEVNTPSCVQCYDREAWNKTPYATWPGMSELGVVIWPDRPDGWWCAQARPPAALELYLAGRAPAALPRFLFVGDDDTWLHVRRLRRLLASVSDTNPSAAPLYLGFAGHQFRNGTYGPPPFCYGGAGYVLNNAALRLLASPAPGGASWLTTCNRWKKGGKWCHYHSDWVVGQCLAAAGAVACDWNSADEQFMQTYDSGAEACMAVKVACHGKLTEAVRSMGGRVWASFSQLTARPITGDITWLPQGRVRRAIIVNPSF